MGMVLRGADELQNDLLQMATQLEYGSSVSEALRAGAKPIETQMRRNASSNPKQITGHLHDSIRTSNVKGSSGSSKKRITIGVHYKEYSAYYANPVEFGHGGPAPAPAHPFVRPAFDTEKDTAYEEMKKVLQKALQTNH